MSIKDYLWSDEENAKGSHSVGEVVTDIPYGRSNYAYEGVAMG